MRGRMWSTWNALSTNGKRLDCTFFFFQAEDGIRYVAVTGVQTCALPISPAPPARSGRATPPPGRGGRRSPPRRRAAARRGRAGSRRGAGAGPPGPPERPGDGLVDGADPPGRERRLALGRGEEGQEGLGRRPRAARIDVAVDDGARDLHEHRGRGGGHGVPAGPPP